MSRWPEPLPDAEPATVDAEDLSRRARDALAPVERSVLMTEACALAQARVRVDTITVAGNARSAMLIPADPGFTILLNAALRARAGRHWRARRWTRFILAHELGHTFFYRPGSRPTRGRRPDAAEEAFCHRFATCLLVPPAAAERARLTPDGLHALAGHYDVPLLTAAWAVAWRRSDISILWLRYSPHPRTGDRETMRVQWSAGSRFFARGESLKSSLVNLAPGDHATSDERLRISGRVEDVLVEAWRFAASMLVVLHHGGLDRPTPQLPARAQMALQAPDTASPAIGPTSAPSRRAQLALFG